MGKSQETFRKKEKEKIRLKKRQDKIEKMQERKANAKRGQTLEEMMAYLDENGNISSKPPDQRKKKGVKREDAQIDTAQNNAKDKELLRVGVVTFFNDTKGFGFIKDLRTNQSVFIHANQLSEELKENDKVTFQTEASSKGLKAVNVKKT